MHPAHAQRVRVVGTGALGSLFAARLALVERAEVTMAGRWREALEAIAGRGLALDDGQAIRRVPMVALRLEALLPPADLILILVKNHQTAAVADLAVKGLAPDGLVLSLQNGLGHREVLERASPGRVACGVATVGARLLSPGHVRAGPGRLEIGRDPRLHGRIARSAALLTDAGFGVTLSDDLEASVWRKLAVNCAVNALSAVRRVENGRLLQDPVDRRVLEEAAREVGRVALARGVRLGADPAALAIEAATRTGFNRSSMLQDVERGAATEIEALNGAVVREARRLGIPTPVNDRLYEQVLALARPVAGPAR
jgi:2-dehydropantoate 2-reductase